MPSHFGTGMVIQTWNDYHKSANLYGTAIPGETVNATTSDSQAGVRRGRKANYT